jgi:hypothetical protein
MATATPKLTDTMSVLGLDNLGRPAASRKDVTIQQVLALASTGGQAQSGIVAGTTRTQQGATLLSSGINRVDTSTAPMNGAIYGDGVMLPASAPGEMCVVINNTAYPITVYGNGTDTINGISPVIMPPNSVDIFWCAASGTWQADLGIGYAGQLDTVLANDNFAASGSNQAGAAQIYAAFNRVTTATALQGVKLPAAVAGLDVIVENHSGVPIIVYGLGTDTIDDVAGATGVNQMDSSVVIFTCYGNGKWYSNGLATGYAKNTQSGSVLETTQYQDGIVAAGTNQATATQLSAALNTVSTVAFGTGVNLPASAPGLQVTVINTGVNALLVYSAQGATDTINGIPATQGVLLFPGTAAAFNCTASGAWTTQPGTTKQAAFNANTATASTTLTAANISGGGASVDLAMTGTLTGAANATLPTVAALVAVLHSPTIGTSYRLRVINESSGNFAWTVLTATGWTLGGTMSIPQNTWREFVVTLTSLTTANLQAVATGTYS